MEPVFPIHVKFEDGDEWILNTVEELITSLEWFDSEDDDKTVKVYDNLGRPIHLKIEKFELIICELIS